jgi:hypothetical protein
MHSVRAAQAHVAAAATLQNKLIVNNNERLMIQ